MKKLFLLALTSAAFAGLASAATVTAFCGSADVNSFTTGQAVASAHITCPAFSSLVGLPGGAAWTGTDLTTLSGITPIIGQGTGLATMTYTDTLALFVYNPAVNNVSTAALAIQGSTNPLASTSYGGLTFDVWYNVTQTSAWLNGNLYASDASSTALYVLWGAQDAGTNLATARSHSSGMPLPFRSSDVPLRMSQSSGIRL
jgi:hypothetical protein